ncbi:hypothetical protein METUNv1_03339 [Methyloversatilis universalis FAM5]|uniref:Uncharacterized protein n=1 Tax=Methyloversatilis universalis (strain ATCC BAA-1314 / DSM 25237 / JCM 13912 / CCUG 52030 / FAM5) TaxID=1000565 RepID=F5RGJ7_METUF|nr:hypothetical protein METUNv1_03339 [Methyloversatilis universalis FAM5]
MNGKQVRELRSQGLRCPRNGKQTTRIGTPLGSGLGRRCAATVLLSPLRARIPATDARAVMPGVRHRDGGVPRLRGVRPGHGFMTPRSFGDGRPLQGAQLQCLASPRSPRSSRVPPRFFPSPQPPSRRCIRWSSPPTASNSGYRTRSPT